MTDAVAPGVREDKQPLQGRTFDGVAFVVPKTSAPWNLKPWTWDLEAAMGWSSLVYLLIPFSGLPKWISVALFVFWRLCYNVGIGYLLHLQSTRHALVSWYNTILNPDPKTRPAVYRWTKKLLSAPRGKVRRLFSFSCLLTRPAAGLRL